MSVFFRNTTEDEAEAANIIGLQKMPNDEQEATNLMVGEQPSAEQHLSGDLQATAETYREEQAAKKSIEGKVDNTKHKLETIKLLENILNRRLHGANATNSDDESMNLQNISKTNNEPKNETYLNLPGENIVMTTVHRNNTETTEVVEHAQSPSGQGARLEQNAKNSEKTKLLDNVSRVASHPLKSEETPLDSESWTDTAGSTKLDQEEAEDLKNIYKYLMDTYDEGKNAEETYTNSPELAGGTDDYPGRESDTSSGPGGMPSSANNGKIKSTRLSTSMNPENESVIHYALGKPLWAHKDSGNKGGHATEGNYGQSAESGQDTSTVFPKKSSGDVKNDDPYVYPAENYLADMANDNGAQSFDDTTDGDSAKEPEYDDSDKTFQDSDFHVFATGGELKDVNSTSNEEKKELNSQKARKVSSATSEKTDSSSNLGVQIPL